MDADASTPTVVRIFESYGWNDAGEIAEQLRTSLEQSGYQVWIDRDQLRPNEQHFAQPIQKALTDCEVVVALLSPQSVRGQTGGDQASSTCYNEVLLAEQLRRPIVPVRVRKFSGPPPFLIIKYRRVDWLDWEHPDAYRKGVREITTAIERALANESLLDPDIAFQASNFAAQLSTAAEIFTGRDWLFLRIADWLAGPDRCLMLEGVTGSGKTAVVAELIRRNPDGRLLAYHFCTPAPLTLDPAGFVRSLAGMLATSIDGYGEQLWSGSLATWLNATDPETMLRQGVLAPLAALSLDTPCYLVVDALDEAIGPDTTISLPALLSGALGEFPSWLKLLVTTRPNQRTQRLFGGAQVCSLDDDNSGQQRDVSEYVDLRLDQLDHGDAADREDVARLIDDRVGGNFQFATTVLDSLARGEMTLAQLNELPRSLEALYYQRAERRFPHPPDYRSARVVLEVLLAAREPLDASIIATVTGLDHDTELQPTLNALSPFAGPHAGAWRVAHKSVADWLRSPEAAEYRIDPEPGRHRLVKHCVDWMVHEEPYALKYLVTHLLESNRATDALAAVRAGLFTRRDAALHEPRLDGEDADKLTAALIAAGDRAGIVSLAQTSNVWQRDGVASALQSAPAAELPFVDGVVAALLAVGDQ